MLVSLLSGRVIFVLSRFQVSLPGDVNMITFVVTYLSLNVTADCVCVLSVTLFTFLSILEDYGVFFILVVISFALKS